jgi:hypothetical protein
MATLLLTIFILPPQYHIRERVDEVVPPKTDKRSLNFRIDPTGVKL